MFGLDDVATGGLISGVGAIGGGIIDAIGGGSAMSANKEIANDNRLFQQQMSNTAYQRATADMQKAGINPMLAYMQGGASTPQGSQANVQNPLSGLGSAVGGAASAVRDVVNQKADLGVKKAQETELLSRAAANTANSGFQQSMGPVYKTLGDSLQYLINKAGGQNSGKSSDGILDKVMNWYYHQDTSRPDSPPSDYKPGYMKDR